MFGISWYLVVNSKLWLKKVIIQPNSNPSHSATKETHHPVCLFCAVEGFEQLNAARMSAARDGWTERNIYFRYAKMQATPSHSASEIRLGS